MGLFHSLSRLFKPRDSRAGRDVCSECGEAVKNPFDLKAAQRAGAEYMAKNTGAKIDFAEPLPLCERCQEIWDDACRDMLGLIGVMKTNNKLTVHDTGLNGSSTYELVIGRDIDPGLAEQLISSNGGNHVYTIHVYEAGERLESFVPRDAYELMKEAMDGMPPVRTAEENVTALNEIIASAKARNGNTGS